MYDLKDMSYTLKDGSTYNGLVRTKVVNLKKVYIKHGLGKQRFIDSSLYDGMWKNGKYHGYGTITYENGDNYEGEFENGLYH